MPYQKEMVCVRVKQTTQDKAREGRTYRAHRGQGSMHELDLYAPHVLTFFTCSEVMALLLRSIAPSATIMIFSLFIPARF